MSDIFEVIQNRDKFTTHTPHPHEVTERLNALEELFQEMCKGNE